MTTAQEPSVVTIEDVDTYAATLDMDRPPVILEALASDFVRGRIATAEIRTRPGGYVPGPTLMAAADWVAWILIFTRIGITPMALTWDLKINFLRPALGSDVVIEATQTKFGKLCHASIEMAMAATPGKMVAHATTTYVLPTPAPSDGLTTNDRRDL